ncbi:MAG: TolC family protein, partial [Colwellia sp.]|nr:TolC family protein [Colwellia sp.]
MPQVAKNSTETHFSKRVKTSSTLSALIMTTLLSGCASGINEQDYLQHQQEQLKIFIADTNIDSRLASSNSSAEKVTVQDETNWWQQFDSSQLNQLIIDALANNHDLKTSQLQLKSALANIGVQQAGFLPQGGVELDSSRSSIDSNISRQSSSNLALSWQLDLFGRLSALVDASEASALAQAEQQRLLHIEVVSSVVKGFVSYQGYLKKQLLVAEQKNALQQSIDVLQAKVDEGEANELDLNRTKAQLNQLQMLVPEIEYFLYRDLATLAVLTGRLTSDVMLKNEQKIISNNFAVKLLKPSEAIAMRPDISQALYQLSQANALSDAARKALLPDISLNAFVAVLSLSSSTLSNSQQQWQVAPQIEWSILSYPALLAQRDAQQYLSEA